MSPVERNPGGGGGSGFANPMTTAGDIIIENAAPAPARLAVGSAGQTLGVSSGLPAWSFGGIGGTTLVYRYTVTGADKASIDTGVDTADAGSNDWTNGDLLEVFIVARTDEVALLSALNVTLNNDTAAHYDLAYVSTNTAASAPISDGGTAAAQSAFAVNTAGASMGASVAGHIRLSCPDFGGTTFNKVAEITAGLVDTTAGLTRRQAIAMAGQFRSTSAITRLAVTPATAAKKLKVGSQLLIYKRLAS